MDWPAHHHDDLVADSSHRLDKGDEIGVKIHAESLGVFRPEELELILTYV
jgi:hypothetical protein